MISIFKEMWAPPKAQATLELTRLYRSLEQMVERRPGASVAITCPHSTDEVMRLAYDLAWVGSTLLGKRVLVLDTMTPDIQATSRAWEPPAQSTASPMRSPSPDPAKPGTDAVVTGPAPKQALIDMDRVLHEPGNVGLLSLRVSSTSSMAIMPQLTEIWGKLQTTFDLILVATPPVLDDPTASCLGSVVDGAVLVVGSGTSRQRDVTRAIELLTSGATPLLGVVMTDRRQTFPRWIRRIFGRV